MSNPLNEWKHQIHLLSEKQKKVLYLFLFISTLVLLTVLSTVIVLSASGYHKKMQKYQQITKENKVLRSKLNGYADELDSLMYKVQLMQGAKDSLSTKVPTHNGKPILLNKSNPLKDTTFTYDTYLNAQTNYVQNRLKDLREILHSETTHQPTTLQVADISDQFQCTPSIYPAFGRISDLFGMRFHPIYQRYMFHYGIDIANKVGTPIYATAQGKIEEAGYDGYFGIAIKINHGYGYETRYAHLYRSLVIPGDVVRKGQIIGYMGDSGLSTGPHLHYEVICDNQIVNPANYLNRLDDDIAITRDQQFASQ